MNATKKITVASIHFIVFNMLLIVSVFASENRSVEKEPLFSIARSRDANEIWYTVKETEKGELNISNPVEVFWLKKTKNNAIEPLTWIQENLAYGVKIIESKPKQAAFHFVSYPKRIFTVRKIGNENKAFTISNNREVMVERIFVNINGGTFLMPVISHVELHGIDPKTGEKTTEILKP